jgi:hypothetical protein
MKILSIDIGIKNLAYAILECDAIDKKNNANDLKDLRDFKEFKIIKWDVINLCNKLISCNQQCCSKEAKFHKDNVFYCKNHTKKTEYTLPTCNIKTLHKQSVANLSALIEQYQIKIEKPINKTSLIKLLEEYLNSTCFEAIETVNANNVNLIDIGISIKNELNELFKNYDLSTIDQIILENQISPIANRMKTIQGMISQYFIDCNNYNIKFISATNKLKPFTSKESKYVSDYKDYCDNKEVKEVKEVKDVKNVKEVKEVKDKKLSYNERKKLSIYYTKQLLENKNMSLDLAFFIKHSKKDDLADCFLQGIYYLENFNVLK